MGNAIAPVALAFSVLEQTPRAADLGWVLAARSIPLVVFLLLGGAVADRLSRRTVLLAANVGAAVTQGGVALVLLSHHYALGVIIVFEFVNGLLTAFIVPATRGIVPQLVSEHQLRRANSLIGSARNAAMIVGPTLAGIIVATANGGWAIAFDAATFLVAALFFARITLPPLELAKGRRILSDIWAGWSEFWRIEWLWTVVTSVGVANYLRTGIWSVLGPIIAIATYGTASWGLVLSARAVGLLAISMVMYRVAVRRMLTFGQASLALGAVPLIALGLHANVYIIILGAFLAGLGSGVFGIAWETSVQENIPNKIISRMTSYDDLISYVAVPIGMATAAPIGLAFGNERVALVGGLLFLLFALLPLLSSSVRHLEHPKPNGDAKERKAAL
jgi:MFS family permease